MALQNRPLSPHLQIYKPQITSVLSITHRMTGVFLAFGALLLAHLLISASYGAEQFSLAQALLGSWFGQLILLGLTFSLFYHMANGVRHLGWDFGKGFDLSSVRMSGALVVLFALAMTALSWIAAYAAQGGAS